LDSPQASIDVGLQPRPNIPPRCFKPAPPSEYISPTSAGTRLSDWDRRFGFAGSRPASDLQKSLVAGNTNAKLLSSAPSVSTGYPNSKQVMEKVNSKKKDSRIADLVKRFSHSTAAPKPPLMWGVSKARPLDQAAHGLSTVQDCESSSGADDDFEHADPVRIDSEQLTAMAMERYKFLTARLSDAVHAASERSTLRHSAERI